MDTVSTYLADHRFQELFIELLGWDRSTTSLEIPIDGRIFSLRSVAHKRGFQVLVCDTDWLAVVNRRLLRQVRQVVAKSYHEHILVFVTADPDKQVWQWAIRTEDGRRFKHREHPFYSAEPPPKLLSRLERLRFTLDEEESVSLVDALDRVRHVLDTTAEQDLFVKHPWYAERSHQLFCAARAGDRDAYEQFITMHLPLVSKIAKKYARAYRLDQEDAEQNGILGLLRAAEKYEPERGFQFSTYATWWVRQACQRLCPDDANLIRIPMHMVWPAFNARRRLDASLLAGGPEGAKQELEEIFTENTSLAARWIDLERCHAIRSLSDRKSLEWKECCSILDDLDWPDIALERAELAEIVRHALSRIMPREREILIQRFGLDGDVMTLEQIAQVTGVTRERIRQLEMRARDKLLGALQNTYRWLFEELRDLTTGQPTEQPPENDDQSSESLPASRSSLKNSLSESIGIS